MYFEPAIFLPPCSYHFRKAPTVEYQGCHHLGQTHMLISFFHKNSSSHGNSQNLLFWCFHCISGCTRRTSHGKQKLVEKTSAFFQLFVYKVGKFEIYPFGFQLYISTSMEHSHYIAESILYSVQSKHLQRTIFCVSFSTTALATSSSVAVGSF